VVKPEITYRIYEDLEKLNYVINFYKNKRQLQVLEQLAVYSLPEQGLGVAKEMAESTIKEYL